MQDEMQQSLLEQDDPQIEFSTEKNSVARVPVVAQQRSNSIQRAEKKQGFLPREFLNFLDLDADKINEFMENQHEHHPSFAMNVTKSLNSKIMNKNQNEFYCIETQKELIHEEVKRLLITVCSQEEYFTTKFEIAPMGRTSQLTFHIKINNEHVFEKTLLQLVTFC